MSELRTRVAWNICERCYPPKCEDLCGECLRQADAAIAIVLEEAAKVAEARDLSIMSSTAVDIEARKIAAAIRALKGKP